MDGWLVGSCAFHFQQEKLTFPSQHKVSVPSYFRLTSVGHTKNCTQLQTTAHKYTPAHNCTQLSFPMRGKMFWLALLQSSALTSPLFPTGVPSVSACQLQQMFQQPTCQRAQVTDSQKPISAVNRCKKVTHIENVDNTGCLRIIFSNLPVLLLALNYIYFQLQAFGTPFF